MIRRRFTDLPTRQVHFREAGTGGIPLLMLHSSPGSSKQLEPLIAAMSTSRHVIAIDTPGNGDSTPLPLEAPEIRDYALAAMEFMDAMGLEKVDLYGSHTGSSIATELAILAPSRVRKIIQDGVSLFSPEERDEYVANYAPVMKPDPTGAYLIQAFMFCRDQYLFWPWYEKNARNARGAGIPPARSLHIWVLEVLKSLETYHLAYRAAFSYPKRERLPLVTQPILAIAGENDPLLQATRQILEFAPTAIVQVTPSSANSNAVAVTAQTIADFLDR